MIPSVNKSERGSTFSPLACSGDMYSGVPMRAPVRVSPDTSIERAMPKSITLIRPLFSSTMMFCGFRSRWITPSECAASSAAHTWRMTLTASTGSNLSLVRRRSLRSWPWTNSIVMNFSPSACPRSKIRMTFLWVTCRAKISSCLKRCRISGFPANSGRMTLIATNLSSSVSRAL